MLTRRGFLLSTASAAAMGYVQAADAQVQGAGAPALNSPVIVNYNASSYNGVYLNIAKHIQPYSAMMAWPSIMSGEGECPNGTFIANATASVLLDPTYYGRYLLSWKGRGALGGISGNPTIIYIGGSFVYGLKGNTGETPGNMLVSGTDANIEFAFGVLISAVSISGVGDHGGSGLVKFTTTNLGRGGNFIDGMEFKFNNLSGLPRGPNSDGSWSIYEIDNNSFSLQGSAAYAGTVSITRTGGPGTQTEGIYSVSSSSANLSGAYSRFSNLVWCRKNDITDIQAGKLVTAEIVAAFAGTNAAYLRFMDMCQVQNIQLPAYANRVLPTDFSWGTNVNKYAYWGGVMTNVGDTFTVPTNPSASPSSGAYVDGEIVVAQVPSGGHNTTANPRLGITGRTGTAPIYSKTCGLLNMTLTGSVPVAGTVLPFVFNGAGLNNFTYNYTVGSSESFQSIANNIRAALDANTTFTNAGWWCQNQNQPGPSFGSWNATLAAFYYNPNVNASGAFSQNAGATISCTDPTGAMTLTFGLVPFGGSTGYLADATICAFTYSAILGGWICTPGAINGGSTSVLGGGPPLEYYAELCARANAGMWLNIGVFDTATSIYNKVLFLAQATYNGQPAIKQLAVEWGNETWNTTEALWTPTQTIAACLGFNINADAGDYSSHGLRTLQMAQQAVQAWSDAGRSRSQLKIVNAYMYVQPNGQSNAPTSATLKYRFEGTALSASGTGTNATLKAIGGLGATAFTTNSSVSPNRPIDWCDWISPAPYWSGAQDAFNISGGIWGGTTISNYNGLLLAAYNYAYGTPTQQSAALDFLYNISANTGDLYNGTVGSVNVDSILQGSWIIGGSDPFAAYYYGLSALLSTIDATRATGGGAQGVIGVGCYEGGWQNGPSNATQITGTLTSLGYTNGYSSSLPGAATGGPTGSSDTAALAAQNIFYLLYGNGSGLAGWRNDARAFALVTQQFNQFRAAARYTNSTRDAYAAWYGFNGPNNIWSLYPGLVTQSAPFQAYNAIAAWR